MARVSELLKYKNIETHKQLKDMSKLDYTYKKDKEIKLGDSTKNLMSNRCYKRVGGRMRQSRQ